MEKITSASFPSRLLQGDMYQPNPRGLTPAVSFARPADLHPLPGHDRLLFPRGRGLANYRLPLPSPDSSVFAAMHQTNRRSLAPFGSPLPFSKGAEPQWLPLGGGFRPPGSRPPRGLPALLERGPLYPHYRCRHALCGSLLPETALLECEGLRGAHGSRPESLGQELPQTQVSGCR